MFARLAVTSGNFGTIGTGTVMLNGIKPERCNVAPCFLLRKHDAVYPRAETQT